ncbi:MAG: lysophospholipase [Gemmatimonadota bacterium]|nr:lysophospholipase [Gemmatimonadota bacterium]
MTSPQRTPSLLIVASTARAQGAFADGPIANRIRIGARSCLLGVVLGAGLGCYHLRIDESYWLRSRPGPSVDSARMLASLPDGYSFSRITVPLDDSTQLAGIVVTREAARATIVYFGGDDFIVALKGPATLRALTMAPVNVVLVDYPGAGGSSGHPTLSATERAATAAYDWAAAQPELARPGVVVYGHSLGSFMAAAVADVRPVRGLVLQGSATNPTDWAHHMFRPANLKWWARLAYPFIRISIAPELARQDNAARLRRYRGPLLILSGTADKVAAPAMSRALADASATPDSLRSLVFLPGAGHEDVFEHPGFAPAYRAFIATVSAQRTSP